MPSWVQDPKTGKLIPKAEYHREQSLRMVMADIEPFVSPVDGSVIGSRSKLREHNKRHGVTDMRDYGDGYFERKAHERDNELHASTARQRRERCEAISESIDKLSR